MLTVYGADIHAKNDAGWTCLHICSRQANTDFINYLIEKGANINEGNSHDKTPLHVGARHGHANVCEILLKYQANVSLVNNYGQSPLYVAVSRASLDKYLAVIKLLIEYGSDVNQTDQQQNNPLHACAMIKEEKHTDSAVSYKRYNNSLVNVKIGQLLIKAGCDPCKQNYLKRTPLHYAAKNNCVNYAALLIEKAPNCINIRDLYKQTALYVACRWKSVDVSNLLLSKKANKDLADISGKTPLHLCAFETEFSSSFMRKLIEHGDDVNKSLESNESSTPLHIAAATNNFKIVSFLLQNEADVNKANSSGETPLHIACSTGSYETAMELLDCGAKINKVTKKGYTVLHSSILAPKNSTRVANLVIDFGVGINQRIMIK